MSPDTTSKDPEPPSGHFNDAPSSSEAASHPSMMVLHDPIKPAMVRRVNSLPDDALAEFHFRERPNPDLYAKQYREFAETVSQHVPQVRYLTDVANEISNRDLTLDSPNQLFTRDTLITLPGTPGFYIPGRMQASGRVLEAQTMRAAVERLGLRPLLELPDGAVLEGGDVLPFVRDGKRSLLIGHGPRSNWTTVEFLRDRLVPEYFDEIIAVWLAPWRVTLDGALVPVAEDVIVAQPDSFQEAFQLTQDGMTEVNLLPLLHRSDARIIEVTIGESTDQMACNCLCLGDRKIVCYDLCPRVCDLLSAQDVEVRTVPGSELVKSRGRPRCMTCPIYQVEARPARAPRQSRGHNACRPSRNTRKALTSKSRPSNSASAAKRASTRSSRLPRSRAPHNTARSPDRQTH